MDNLSFPNLKFDEIVGVLGECGVTFTSEDLTSPGSIRMVFEYFAEIMLGANKSPKQPEFAGLSHISHPELHEESIPEAHVLSAMIKIGLACRIPDFSSKDLNHPDKKRSIQLLSGLINFSMFRDEITPEIHRMVESTDQYKKQELQSTEEVRKLREQLQKLEHKRRQEEPEVKKLEAEMVALEAQVIETNAEQQRAIEKKHQDKAKLLELSDRITHLKFQTNAVRQQTAQLKSVLVPDPEALERSIKEKREKLEALKTAHAAEERRGFDLKAKEASVQRVEKEMTKALKVLEESQVGIDNRTVAKTTLREVQERLAECQSTTHNLQQAKQMVQKKLEYSREKESKNLERMAASRKAAEQKTKELNQKRVEIEDERVQTVTVLNNNGQEKQMVQQQIEAATKKHNAEMSVVAQRFEDLEERLTNYQSGLRKITSV